MRIVSFPLNACAERRFTVRHKLPLLGVPGYKIGVNSDEARARWLAGAGRSKGKRCSAVAANYRSRFSRIEPEGTGFRRTFPALKTSAIRTFCD
jgi:hypothetical protein